MESPEDIEKALARLMPSAISEKGQRSMDDLIDSLAAGEVVEVEGLPAQKLSRPYWSWFGGIGAAAAAVIVAMSLPQGGSPMVADNTQTPATPSTNGDLVLIGSTEVVEDAVPEDWMSETDGVPHRAWRVRVVDQERLRDVQTGYEVLVSHPREEVRLMPVTSF
ncbi:hypothetical protein OKA04_01255 [Luteolibacter flavescens]|uniref:Uncharacterized protein n=1 Tax=Luteolibacter flavescens TaxID=1859460 RepID=A0ABT3FID7_9BACT|nr:hypothetical protein [Luteolibacter flavescens]MCW1883336.1 hypothetical protein [Luteolibacter flavescens]